MNMNDFHVVYSQHFYNSIDIFSLPSTITNCSSYKFSNCIIIQRWKFGNTVKINSMTVCRLYCNAKGRFFANNLPFSIIMSEVL
jgi:hypothetical protein